MWLIFKKEITELLRDRKTLFFMIALPILLFPLIFGVVGYLSMQAIDEVKSKTLNFAVIGAQYSPDLMDKIKQVEQFNFVEMPADQDVVEYVKSEAVDFVVEIPENYSDDPLMSGKISLNVYLNDAGLNMIEKRLGEIVNEISTNNQTKAFEQLGVNTSQMQALLEPIAIEKINVADDRENWGEKIGGFFPYIIFMLCLQGAMLPATDLGAGEKERGTLETLLISPVERYQIVLGKFLAIALSGVMSALVTVVSMAIWGMVLSRGMAIEFVAEFMSAFSAIDFVLVFLMLVPIVSIFSSLLLSLSIYARSFKEAQGYMTPLVVLTIIPVMMAMMPGVELKGGWAWVPLTNVALAIKELIKGTMDYMALIPIFGSTALIALALLAFCVYWFNKEKVLFR